MTTSGGGRTAGREQVQDLAVDHITGGNGAGRDSADLGGADTAAREKDMNERPRNRLASLLRQEEFKRVQPRRGQVYQATIMSISEHDILVDLGAKRDGAIPPSDLELVGDEAYLESLQVGDQVPVVLLKRWSNRGTNLVSLNKGLQQHDWIRAKELQEAQAVTEAEVVDVNRGGVLVQFGGIQGFVPNSHLVSIRRGLSQERRRQAKEALIGEMLGLAVIEVDQRRRRLVMSERVANKHRHKKLLAELTPGEVRTGTVQNLVDFGAFVDLGGIDGLIHISELDHGHVNHPSDVLSIGDTVQVYVLEVDRERMRISLSRKRLMPDPWESTVSDLRPGGVVEGRVTGLQKYGAFVDIGRGIEGLAHISHMRSGQDMLDQLATGRRVAVEVLNIDSWQKQIGLRLEQVLPEPSVQIETP